MRRDEAYLEDILEAARSVRRFTDTGILSERTSLKMRRIASASLMALAILASGCVARVYAPAPAVSVQPAPGPVITYAPDYYVWEAMNTWASGETNTCIGTGVPGLSLLQ